MGVIKFPPFYVLRALREQEERMRIIMWGDQRIRAILCFARAARTGGTHAHNYVGRSEN